MCLLLPKTNKYVIFTPMELTLTFKNVEPISLNHAIKYRRQDNFISSYKSDGYKALERQIDAYMSDCKELLNEFNKYYDETKHYLVCSYRFYYPIFTKKDGRISKRSKDASNIVKPIEDCIFKYLSADDSEVIDLNVTKIHSEDIKTITEIKIKSLHSIK